MSMTSTKALTVLAVLVSFAQAAEARSCYYDAYGRRRCTGLLGGTIGGIIVACVVPIIFALLLLMCCLRRRRSRRVENEAYVNQPQQQMYEQPAGNYGPGPQQYGQQQSYVQPQQYEQPATQSYAPPAGAPPSSGAPMYEPNQYAAPPGAPPAAHPAGGEASAYYGNRV